MRTWPGGGAGSARPRARRALPRISRGQRGGSASVLPRSGHEGSFIPIYPGQPKHTIPAKLGGATVVTGTLNTTQVATDDIPHRGDRRDGRHRAAEAAREFRKLDQEQVDRIVEAMVRAGVRAAGNWPAWRSRRPASGSSRTRSSRTTWPPEFLHDYLRDKKSVGVIDEDVEHNIVYVAEPIGVVLALTPVTNPPRRCCSKAIVAAKTRNAVLFRPSPYAVRCCERAVEILREAAEAAGMPPGAAGDPGRRARRHPPPVPPPQSRLHLGHRRTEDRQTGQPGR